MKERVELAERERKIREEGESGREGDVKVGTRLRIGRKMSVEHKNIRK